MLKEAIARETGLSISKLHDAIKDAGLDVRKADFSDQEVEQIKVAIQAKSQQQPHPQQRRAGATAGTPQEALATIQGAIQPVAQYVLNTHASLVQQRDQFIQGAVQATRQEIALTPALYLQELQKELQGDALVPKDQMVQAFDLNPICSNVFALPATSQSGLDAMKLLGAGE